MTPGARVAAAIEVLDAYLSGTPAEQALSGWTRGHRFAGSKDRAALRDHVFDALRRLRSSAALGGGQDGRATMIGLLRGQGIDPDSLFTGEGHAPARISPAEYASLKDQADLTRGERLDCPDWLLARFDKSLADQSDAVLDALRHRAPVFLRVNTARATREEVQALLAQDAISTTPHDLASTALLVNENPRKINGSRAFLDGLVELQDAASQAVIEALNVQPGMRVLDYCAGGGGKALALAALGADVVAHDIAPARMIDLPTRATRAGCDIKMVTTPELNTLGDFDLVLADAPCSGSGSWRRAPQGKWLLDAQRLSSLCQIQSEILTKLSELTHRKAGNTAEIAYATCSVLVEENHEQVAQFVLKHPSYDCVEERQFMPLDGGDGFYVARLRRK